MVDRDKRNLLLRGVLWILYTDGIPCTDGLHRTDGLRRINKLIVFSTALQNQYISCADIPMKNFALSV